MSAVCVEGASKTRGIKVSSLTFCSEAMLLFFGGFAGTASSAGESEAKQFSGGTTAGVAEGGTRVVASWGGVRNGVPGVSGGSLRQLVDMVNSY